MCVGLFSFAKLLSMPVLGYWSDKRPMREPLMASVLTSAVGNIMYITLF